MGSCARKLFNCSNCSFGAEEQKIEKAENR